MAGSGDEPPSHQNLYLQQNYFLADERGLDPDKLNKFDPPDRERLWGLSEKEMIFRHKATEKSMQVNRELNERWQNRITLVIGMAQLCFTVVTLGFGWLGYQLIMNDKMAGGILFLGIGAASMFASIIGAIKRSSTSHLQQD